MGHFSDIEHWGDDALSPAEPVSGPTPGSSRSTSDASSDDGASIDEACSAPVPHAGHQARARTTDTEAVETLIDALRQIAEGAKTQQLGRKKRFAALLFAFDAEAQLKPPQKNHEAKLFHDRLSRLVEGNDEHRALAHAFDIAMHKAGKRFWGQTVQQMRAVRKASAKLRADPPWPKKDVVSETERRFGSTTGRLIRQAVSAEGIFKAPAHADSHADGLRGRIERLQTKAAERYPIALDRWQRFEAQQSAAADAAAELKRPRRRDTHCNVVEAHPQYAHQLIDVLKRLTTGGLAVSLTSIVGDTDHDARKLIDREGGLTFHGHDFVHRLRPLHPELAQRIVAASAEAVAATRERHAEVLRDLTRAILQVKQDVDGSLDKLANAMVPQTRHDRDLRTAMGEHLQAAGTRFKARHVDSFLNKTARLELTADAAQRRAMTAFLDALSRPHPHPLAPAPQALDAKLQEARARAAAATQRHGRPPRAPRARGTAAGAAAASGTAASQFRSPSPGMVSALPASVDLSFLPRLDTPSPRSGAARSQPATPDLNLSPPPEEGSVSHFSLPSPSRLEDLPEVDLSALPEIDEAARAPVPRLSLVDEAARHLGPVDRVLFFNAVNLLDASLGVRQRLNDLLHDDPRRLQQLTPPEHEATVALLFDLLGRH